MPIRTRRWNDRRLPGDGQRLLVCRYRPRGVRKSEETWDEWDPDLGPSRALHADVYGKSGPPIPWEEYRERFLAEIAGRRARIEELAARVRAGETITLLCSSACAEDARVWFSKIRVNDEGRVDPHHRHETAKLARSETPHVAHPHAGTSVVAAGHRFAMRRLSHLREWRPEESDLAALRAVVNTKAGKQML